MSVTDPIADFLTSIRNAVQVKKRYTDIPCSTMKKAVAELLVKENFIRGYKVIEDAKQNVLRVYLKYGPGEAPVIRGIKRISTPGRRVYVHRDDIPRTVGGLGMSVLSTTMGILSDRDARRAGLGGEVICTIW